jgi:hypothetical protein
MAVEERTSLDDLMEKANRKVNEYTLSEATGKSERELAHMTDKQLAKITEEAVKELRDEAVEKNETTVLSWTDKNGERQEIKIVPATLDTAEANAKNDKDELANYYMNGKQTSPNGIAAILKRNIVQGTINAPKNFMRRVTREVEKGAAEFGR